MNECFCKCNSVLWPKFSIFRTIEWRHSSRHCSRQHAAKVYFARFTLWKFWLQELLFWGPFLKTRWPFLWSKISEREMFSLMKAEFFTATLFFNCFEKLQKVVSCDSCPPCERKQGYTSNINKRRYFMSPMFVVL